MICTLNRDEISKINLRISSFFIHKSLYLSVAEYGREDRRLHYIITCLTLHIVHK